MFFCSDCGYKSIKWLGKCPVCGSWESFQEELNQPTQKVIEKPLLNPTPLSSIDQYKLERTSTHIEELDKLLGGGLVQGEVVLVGGEPGVGKSTLLLEVSARLVKKGRVLYVSAEESIEQVGLRAKRLGISHNNLYLLNEDNLEQVYKYLKDDGFRFLIIDSIQVVYHPQFGSQKGSVSQIKGCADFLTQVAKTTGIVVFIIGHVTKEGVIAGPKLLEHIVDCVLYFESEVISNYRVLRAMKNRFGPAGELAAFEMTSQGLREAENLTELFLPHKENPIAGSCTVCVIEGIRPIILELQSLVSKASFGMVRRRSLGFDFNRFSLLVAILEKRVRISFSSEDVFLSVSGGVKINDPSADVGACLAIISSYKEKVIPPKSVFLGELGLAGEIRPVSNINLRIKEIKRAGFKKVFIPKANFKEVEQTYMKTEIEVKGASFLKELLGVIW